MQECNGRKCKWINRSPHIYDCLTCGKHRNLRKNNEDDPVWTFIVLMSVALIVTIIVGGNQSPKTSPSQSKSIETPQIKFVENIK